MSSSDEESMVTIGSTTPSIAPALVVSMYTTRSPASRASFASTASCVMVPATGAHTAVSIFIADMITSCCPAVTTAPVLTCTSMMVPAMGAPTLPRSARSAFSRTAFFPTATSACLSTTSTTRGTPFASKNTSRLPFDCSSPMALNLMLALTPLAISTSISSSSSRGARKARVGRRSTRLEYFKAKLMYSSNTLGYMAALRTSLREMLAAPHFSLSRYSRPSRSRGASEAPGRPWMVCLPFSTLERSGSGKPAGGCPR
mmetsp:Transcript_5442/g.9419  ORF Transcript_5442/g.9419 Transcript_5442/m.9419 type:complete len:258 (-) Transcript_5442:2228-3001(-)